MCSKRCAPRAERLVFELFTAAAPSACANFAALCAGSAGRAKGSGVPLHYRGSRLHRLVRGAFLQGGDFVFSNGAGGESIWGGKFKDEAKALGKLDARGLLCMSNDGKNSNGSQFFVTLAPLPKLNGKHVVFGRLVEGAGVLDAIEAVACDGEAPRVPIVVADSGVLP